MIYKQVTLSITGMQCNGCETIIQQAIEKLDGIQSVNVSYRDSQAIIRYNQQILSENKIIQTIIDSGYGIQSPSILSRGFKALIFITLLLAVGSIVMWGKSLMPNLMPQMNAEASYFMLFSIGFLTGFHCIGMCGGFVVSYAEQANGRLQTALAHLAYASGKTLSYSVIGALFGLLGAMLTITMHMRGVAALFAGVFLIVFGLKMLNIFPALRRFSFHWPKAFNRNVNKELHRPHNPLMLGVFSGLLLGCGPLQAMYITAAGMGNPTEGAKLLFFFSLGTLIPLLSFGVIAQFLPRGVIHHLVKVSAILVISMGLMMSNRGLKMTQSGYDLGSLQHKAQQFWQQSS
jgi:sulfite exporter TauE/SafE/copper chaperone CopZ